LAQSEPDDVQDEQLAEEDGRDGYEGVEVHALSGELGPDQFDDDGDEAEEPQVDELDLEQNVGWQRPPVQGRNVQESRKARQDVARIVDKGDASAQRYHVAEDASEE